MIVLTVDQVDSRHGTDLVQGVLKRAGRLREQGAVLGPDRTAGDEFQLVFQDARAALDTALQLHRTGAWTVGIGAGRIAGPLPDTAREASGSAFSSARVAVEQAKRAPHRMVVVAEEDPAAAEDLTALLQLLLDVRSRRSPEGWAVGDLLAAGLTQAAAAEREGITPQAVSLRVKAGGVRIEQAAAPALGRLLEQLDRRVDA